MATQPIIYLDNMASTPIAPEVTKLMHQCMTNGSSFANPDAQHELGHTGRTMIENARSQVAHAIGATPESIIWTSGATEANNLALQGAAQAYQRQGKHIITLATEHKAVLNVCAHLARQGFEVTYLKPQHNGLLDLTDLEKALRPDTILVSISHVNNEIGVVQNIPSIAACTHAKGAILHVDAAQSMGKTPLDVTHMQADLISLSAHKAYGPKGIGALWMRPQPRLHITPLCYGGGQEQNLRPGTLPTELIAGMGLAFELAHHQLNDDLKHIDALREHLWQRLHATLPNITRNGHPTQSVPHNLNISFEGVDGESLMYALQTDLAISSGSACNAATLQPSHVLTALGISRTLADSSIRFSLGRYNTLAEIERAADCVIAAVRKLRQQSPLWGGEGAK